MRALTAGLMSIVLAGGVAACDGSPTTASAFAPESEGPVMSQHSSSLTFTYTQSQTTQDPQTASGATRAIDFGGSVTTGTPCYDVSATHDAQPGAVTVTVSANDTGEICTQVITYNNYQGRVRGLSAGTYDFTVVHNVNGTSSVAFSGQVTVR